MKTAVVTGATSMLGIATIRHLIDNGINVVAISRPNSRGLCALPKSDLVTSVGCDLKDLSTLNLGNLCADVFYHFGWGFTDKENRNNLDLQIKNVDYTMSAIELAHNLGCSRFLGAGSQAEYGFKDYVIDESAECNPGIAYGHAKLEAYKQGRKKCKEYGMDYIWTRTFSVYGLNDDNSVAMYAIDCLMKKEKAKFSASTQSWNFLFDDDAGEYFYRLGCFEDCHFDSKLKDGDRIDCIVNIANEKSQPLKSYFEEMKKALGDEFDYELAPEEKGVKLNGINPDVTRLLKITGYTPKCSFEYGMSVIKKTYC